MRYRRWFSLITVAFVVLSSTCYAAYHMGACSHYPAWPVDFSDSEEAMTDFQQFIQLWQFDNQRCEKGPVTSLAAGGFGISIVYTNMKNFFLSLEFGKVFRPMGHYFWADTNSSECTLGIDSLDCYHELLSPCGLKGFEHMMIAKDPNATKVDRAIYPSLITDMCMLGTVTKKPMVWVLGQMIHYETRLNKRILPLVKSRVQTVMQKRNRSTTGIVMAVHVRAGKPDRGRRVLSMDTYMEAVDLKAKELAELGQHVELVYFASQHHESTFVSVDYMNQHYPRNFSYAILPITPQNGQV